MSAILGDFILWAESIFLSLLSVLDVGEDVGELEFDPFGVWLLSLLSVLDTCEVVGGLEFDPFGVWLLSLLSVLDSCEDVGEDVGELEFEPIFWVNSEVVWWLNLAGPGKVLVLLLNLLSKDFWAPLLASDKFCIGKEKLNNENNRNTTEMNRGLTILHTFNNMVINLSRFRNNCTELDILKISPVLLTKNISINYGIRIFDNIWSGKDLKCKRDLILKPQYDLASWKEVP
jgi:hypothetical protein